ncbi:MAG: hypothetical protein RR840_06730 [Clostridium sp.]
MKKKKLISASLAGVMAVSAVSGVVGSVEERDVSAASANKLVHDVNAKIEHITYSLKKNYLGLKNVGQWQAYLKEANTLNAKLPKGSSRDRYQARINRAEALVNASARVNKVEQSMEVNAHTIKNVPQWSQYIVLAKEDLGKVDLNVFKPQYNELLERVAERNQKIEDIKTTDNKLKLLNKEGEKVSGINYGYAAEMTGNKVTLKDSKFKGNLTIKGNQCNLVNTVVEGKIILDPGVNGVVNITGVKAKEIVVLSGAEKSIYIDKSTAEKLTVDSKSSVRVKLTGETGITNTFINSSSILDNASGTIKNVVLGGKGEINVNLSGVSNSKVYITSSVSIDSKETIKNAVVVSGEEAAKIVGNFENLVVDKIGANLNLSGNIGNLNVNTSTDIKIESGKVENILGSSNSNVNVEAAPGVTVGSSNGVNVSGGTTPPPTGGGGGGSISPEETPAEKLAKAKVAAKKELEEHYKKYKEVDYSKENWAALNKVKSDGVAAIDGSESIETVQQNKASAMEGISSIKTVHFKAVASVRNAGGSETDKGGYGINVGFENSTTMKDLTKLEVSLYKGDKKLATNSMAFDRIKDDIKNASKVDCPFNLGSEGVDKWSWNRGAYQVPEILDDSVVPNKVVVNYTVKGVNYIYTEAVNEKLPIQNEANTQREFQLIKAKIADANYKSLLVDDYKSRDSKNKAVLSVIDSVKSYADVNLIYTQGSGYSVNVKRGSLQESIKLNNVSFGIVTGAQTHLNPLIAEVSKDTEVDLIKLKDGLYSQDVTLNKNIKLQGTSQEGTVIKGYIRQENGTMDNLTITNISNTPVLDIGATVNNMINLTNVKIDYPIFTAKDGIPQGLRKTLTNTVSGNNSTINIENCKLVNTTNNQAAVKNVAEWSYGLYINNQGKTGNINFKNNVFKGTFRTMLPSINGNFNIEGCTFENDAFTVADGPTNGAMGECTSLTTANIKSNIRIENNTFVNPGSMFFQVNATVNGNTITFNKGDLQHYIQKRGGFDFDLTGNTFNIETTGLVLYGEKKQFKLPTHLTKYTGFTHVGSWIDWKVLLISEKEKATKEIDTLMTSLKASDYTEENWKIITDVVVAAKDAIDKIQYREDIAPIKDKAINDIKAVKPIDKTPIEKPIEGNGSIQGLNN